jgi:hypothetical protein
MEIGGPPFGSIGDDVSISRTYAYDIHKLTCISQTSTILASALAMITHSKTSTLTRSCMWATTRTDWADSAVTLTLR